jgi:CrcB protein
MKMIMIRCLAVGFAGFFGAIARYMVTLLFGSLNERFPVGTLFINVTGCFFLGWFLTYVAARNVPDNLRLAIGVGFVGAYTTFSTYIWDCSRLADDGAMLKSTANLIGSLVLGIIAVRLGMMLARMS